MAHEDVTDLSTEQAAEMAGLTYRQLDSWIRQGVIVPFTEAHGSGTARRWNASQVRTLRLLSVLRDLGAGLGVLAAAAREADELSERAWDARVLVTQDGRFSTLLGADANGYLVDLSCLRVSSVAEAAERALASVA